MKVTITTLNGDVLFNLDVADDLELGKFKEACAPDAGIKGNQMDIIYEGARLSDDAKPLSHYKIKEGDVLLAQAKATTPASPIPQTGSLGLSRPSGLPAAPLLDFSSVVIPGALGGNVSRPSGSTGGNRPSRDDPVFLRDMFLSNPEQLAMLRSNNPQLADALEKGVEEFKRVFDEQKKMKEEKDRMQLRLLQADPFDPEAQRLIQEEINRQNIASNMETALEFHPESFGSVTMLYINCRVNGHPIKAFVDSGAQSTIMSSGCAARCNVTHLIDSRWSGIAKGVGTQKIIGRIHLGQIQIEEDFLPSSFLILEQQDMDFLLGLDMLKRHQCSIDLKDNVLIIGTTGTKTRFLNESEIPTNDKFS
ncbi:protein DDI1 homolog 2 [Tetranychus urticae]|uniref:Ubiquitin-like domain-containing protein n=1 Tax=Tetranychus urticae TaxID=32264 RepID=T1KQZ0_TETUR|nr:protein DDI1 homolog 2 [Tetranychus urticae]